MALKDLIATRHQLNESAIENVIKDFVRYDTTKDEIVLTPAATALPNKMKILVYLVALEGWAYVKPELEGKAAKPMELERELGIPGGSLRPALRELAARRLVRSDDGAYRIVPANLSAVVDELTATGTNLASPAARRPKRKAAAPSSTSARAKAPPATKAPPKAKARKSVKGGDGAAAMFASWIDAGFFKNSKSMKDMLQEFRNKGVIMKMTSLSKLPLGAVRSGALVRRKGEQNGKQVWLYTSEG